MAEPGFDPHTCYYGGHGVARHVGHAFAWLRGEGDRFRIMGGQAWQWMTENQIGTSYGYNDPNSRHLPAWGHTQSDDGYARPDTVSTLLAQRSGSGREGRKGAHHEGSIRGVLKRALVAFASKL